MKIYVGPLPMWLLNALAISMARMEGSEERWKPGCNSSKCWQSMRAFWVCVFGFCKPSSWNPDPCHPFFASWQLEMINMQSRQRWTIFICISQPSFSTPGLVCQAFFLEILCKNNLLRCSRSPDLSQGIKVLFPMAAASVPAAAALIALYDAIL